MVESGERLGEYTLLELLGQKGVTELWSGRADNGDQVIIHTTPVRSGVEAAHLEQLQETLKLAKTFRHKNILRTLGGGVESKKRYIVSEYVDGLFLDRVLDACRSVGVWPSAEVSTFIVYEVARAMAYVHRLTAAEGNVLIHRELCPASIMVDRSGGVKVAELGSGASQNVIETAGQKRSGLVAYSSPELATDQKVDQRSDVFALGAIFWELLAGRPLFHRATDLETLEAVRSAAIPPLPGPCPQALSKLVRSCLARAPEERPSGAGAVLEQLELFDEESIGEASGTALQGLLEQVTSGSGKPKKGKTFVFSKEDSAGQKVSSGETVRSDPPSEVLRIASGEKEPRSLTRPLDDDPFFDAVRDGGGFENPRFEMLGRLGSGGMGEVYRVRDRELGEIVALKVIPNNAQAQMQSLERLRREVRLARKIASDHVCRIYDIVDLGGDKRGLTMALVDGVPLSELMKTGVELDYARFARWGAEIAEGLYAAHSLSIVHRDLKPENIMVRTQDDGTVLLDFGIARSKEEEKEGLTQAGIIMGTPLYMSPEQLSNMSLDGRSDLYALGLILAELITGEVPSGGANYSEILDRRVIKAKAFRLNEIDPEAPWPIAEVVDALLHPAADDRPEDAELVRKKLRAFLGQSSEASEDEAEETLNESRTYVPPPEPTAHLPPAGESAEVEQRKESKETKEREGAEGPKSQPTQNWFVAVGLLILVGLALAIFLVRQGDLRSGGPGSSGLGAISAPDAGRLPLSNGNRIDSGAGTQSSTKAVEADSGVSKKPAEADAGKKIREWIPPIEEM